MLRADRSGAPRVQADILRLPMPDGTVDGVTCGFALRNLVDLPAFFAELARVVRPGGRIALLDVGVPRNRLVRFGHGIYFGKVVPRDRRAAVRRRGVPLPATQRRLPAAARRDGRAAARAPGSPTPTHRVFSGRHHPAAHRHAALLPDRPDAGRHSARRRRHRAVDLNDIARGDGFLFVRDGVGFAGRGVAARVAVDDVPAVLAAIDHVDETGFDGARSGVGPVALGWVPFAPGGAGEARRARGRRRQGRRRLVLGHQHRRRRRGSWRRRRRRWRRPTPTRSSRSRPSSATSTPSPRHATRCAPDGSPRR